MITPQEAFKTLGKCYYFSLAFNVVFLLTFGLLIFLLFKEKANPEYKLIFTSIEENELTYQFISLLIIFYFTFCILLNLGAGLVFFHNKLPAFQFPIVIVNLLSFPFGTIISIFTLYILKKM